MAKYTGTTSNAGDTKTYDEAVSACSGGGGGVGSRLITSADWGALTYCHYSLNVGGTKYNAALPNRKLGDI